MTNSSAIKRMPAEWEMKGAVLMAWPHEATDWAYMLDDVRECFRAMVEAMIPWTAVVIVAPDVSEPAAFLSELHTERLFFMEVPTNDTWARDFGPISVELSNGEFSACDFRFNGWGLKFAADKDNLVNGRMKVKGLIRCNLLNRQNFVLEGGGIESNGDGILMTTSECQLSPNRNPWMSRSEIEQYLLESFNAKKLIWLDHGFLKGDDTDSHIDTLARFAPGNTIIYTGCDDPEDVHFSGLAKMEQQLKEAKDLDGNPFNLIRLPLPDAIHDEAGKRLPATYANFLALPNVVIMPVYGQPKKDALACQMLQIAFDVPIVTVDCRALIRQHGSLHCMTMQMPSQILPF